MEPKDEVKVEAIDVLVNYEINQVMMTLLDVVDKTNDPKFNTHSNKADNITKLVFVKAAADLIMDKINRVEKLEVRSGIEVTE